MKIKTLRLNNFKGFANEIEINLRGKNLVVYGENGSGKTSLVEALKLPFDSASSEIELESYENVFTKEPVEISIETTDGKTISLKTKLKKKVDDKGNERSVIVTDPDSYDSDEKTFLDALSRSTSILSYRQLMKIYDLSTPEDFYELFVKNVMAHYLIPPRGEKTLIEELQELEELKEKSPRAKKRILDKEESIKSEINKIFAEIHEIWNNYVRRLTGDNIEIECSIEELGKLNFNVKWNSKDVSDILTYLNEGRLNAISLGLFLAYYKRFNVSKYKMLLLDDVVIGLDMNLRIPLLDILREDFEDEYQIVITTFDENWFNLMKQYLDGSKWEFLRLVVRKTDSTDLPFIVGVEQQDYLDKAKQHLNKGDIPAAALYVRLEFERIVKNFAKKKKLKVPYESSNISDIWNEVKAQLNRAKTLIKRVETYRSILLNPSVHYDPRPKYLREVEFAIGVVEKLGIKIKKELNR
ncbi:Recombinational DNA repair ATPase {RecF pathway} [Geoglobus ahangari]|uniref:Recombinational DNA repair ATPase (RecF pathway) n=1 Tax=Geoglobus ahangari TaxID=113653 RepID=A0A0F7IFJ8_9EURY|nr:AAA family ATPase [Geoglobus ahangari]AKG91654.1 Recombinational DNA repair ATPase {RecF pathway} [Geoglobus ahangari]